MPLRVTVVSHACVVASNQSPYVELSSSCDVTLVVPERWRDTLRPEGYTAERSAQFTGRFLPVRTVGVGHPQRHFSLVGATKLLTQACAEFVVIEEEPFSMSALKWSRAAHRLGIPFAVQVAENLPKKLPAPLEHRCRRILEQCSFVLSRSPAALERAVEWGYRGPPTLIVHGVDDVADAPVEHPSGVVGFVGRLVDAKGVDDLARALQSRATLNLRVAGEGPRRDAFSRLGERAVLLGTLSGDDMSAFYESVSVLAVPSRTTPTWSEQFGRVIIEAAARATPVVAYDSGEIPWVGAELGAELVTEGDVAALGERLDSIASDPTRARELGERARLAVSARFSNHAVARALEAAISDAVARPR